MVGLGPIVSCSALFIGPHKCLWAVFAAPVA